MSNHPVPGLDTGLLAALAHNSTEADRYESWPAASWQQLSDRGLLAWSVPRQYGGLGLGALDLLVGYEKLAGACLTTAFILSQREAAVRRLVASENSDLARRWLPPLARGEAFGTVGLSQLTTSRQHGAPALRATREGSHFRLDGVIPWVTGADRAEVVIVGATLEDERQVLFAVACPQQGMKVELPLPLMALAGSRTAQIRCQGLKIGPEALLAGPCARILSGKPGGVGGLETSCLALGHAGAAIDYLAREAVARPDLVPVAERFEHHRQTTRARLHGLASGTPSPEAMAAIRVDCTRLALQATQVALTVAKGAGFVTPHAAQRWARQALFFLVWSCPRPAAEGLIQQLLPEGDNPSPSLDVGASPC
jgi:alkylation response protein AidB-like acyl-CoA dehydrogenase